MTIDDVLRQIGKELGLPDSVIEGASNFSKAAAAKKGEAALKAIQMELTDEQVTMFRIHGLATLLRFKNDPNFKEKFLALKKKIDQS